MKSSGVGLAGETVGEGPPIVLLHGLTATRRYVVHGSNALPRRGYRLVSYDARAHGESEPAPEGQSYDYPALSGDLGHEGHKGLSRWLEKLWRDRYGSNAHRRGGPRRPPPGSGRPV